MGARARRGGGGSAGDSGRSFGSAGGRAALEVEDPPLPPFGEGPWGGSGGGGLLLRGRRGGAGGFWLGRLRGARAVLLGSKLNLLLLFLPVAFLGAVLSRPFPRTGEGLALAAALLALVPLAERLGFATESVADQVGEALGALLNCSFGNATELIVSIAALRKGQLRVVQLSMLGSILSNCLLVLGSSLLAGGLRKARHRGIQLFNPGGASASMTLLALTAFAAAVCTELGGAQGSSPPLPASDVLVVSRGVSVLLLVVYSLFLTFQLYSHTHMFNAPAGMQAAILAAPSLRAYSASLSSRGGDGTRTGRDLEAGAYAALRGESFGGGGGSGVDELDPAGSGQDAMDSESDIAGVQSELPLWDGIFWLAAITVTVAVLSEIIVEGIEKGASHQLHIPTSFLSAILLPIVGNAAEHASAIIFAYRGRMSLTMGIAVGSSVQVATFVLPLCVLLAWAMGQGLSLDLHRFGSLSFIGSVVLVWVAVQDGQGHWLKGVVLVLAYFVLSLAYWVLPWDGKAFGEETP